MAEKWQVLGIDPAPTKDTVVRTRHGWACIAATDLRRFITTYLEKHPNTLIAWDAPVAFRRNDLYDRKVDKVVREWIRRTVRARRFAPGAISARSFAALPHWAVSCVSIGFPIGRRPSGLAIAGQAPPASPSPILLEVHPAVALGTWWLDRRIRGKFPRYKRNPGACEQIAGALNLPACCGQDDDFLDSWVAYKLGRLYLQGRAGWLGHPLDGGYVLPNGDSLDLLREDYARSR